MPHDLVLKSRRVILPGGERPAAVGIRDGKIAAIGPYAATAGDDLGELVLLPGLVDTHVHINEPGRTDWEGFTTATKAAAAGGVTTLIDMPLNCIPATTTVGALELKRAIASTKSYVDVGFWGGAVPGNLAELPGLHDAGVFGFKAFLSPSGVDEFGHLTVGQLRCALSKVDAAFLIHAEDPANLAEAPSSVKYADFLASRPPQAESQAIASVIEVARATGARVHILHLSSAEAVGQLREARQSGVRITVETCPHYLTLAAESVPDADTAYKCCPPIREQSNQDELWAALSQGVIDSVVSDHSPSPKLLKEPDFGAAWGGISSLQLGLPVMWTEAQRRGFALTDVVRWMATRPAEIMGVPGKGRIEVGYDADLVAFAPDEAWTVDPHHLGHRHPVTPYAGHRLNGTVRQVWLSGVAIDSQPRGSLLRPSRQKAST